MSATTYTALHAAKLSSALTLYRFKKDIPDRHSVTPILINFGLWGCAYAVETGQGLRCRNGGTLRYHVCHPHGHAPVIGQRDLREADSLGIIHPIVGSVLI